MSEKLVDKVRLIIEKRLQDPKFSVSELASELGLSRSQALRRIKASTGKSVNRLIRDIRLEKATQLLADNQLTASEIAYQVGFSSPSYFNKCFLDEYGVTPGEYKKSVEKGETALSPVRKTGIRVWSRKPAVTIIFFAIIVLSVFTVILILKSKQTPYQASIAVLPFQDFSENQDKGFLADGITESITEALARNKNLRVISRGSAMRYKGTDILYPEIAKELNVTLLLEGSVMHADGNTRIVVQLIDPLPVETHLWQKSYTKEQGNILGLVQDVSALIAGEIFSTLRIDTKKVQKTNVDNRAFELYLKGRHIWNTMNISTDGLLSAVGYLEQAIQIEPKFAPAYVTMAEAYISINTLIGDNEEKMRYRENARIAIDKALQLDESLADAYITKGNLVGKLNWDWEGMKKLAEKGLELEPSNMSAHLTLSNYYVVKGNYKKAIVEAHKAEELDPVNPMVACLVAERYYIDGQFDRAISKLEEVIDLNPTYGFAYNNIGFVYFKAGYPEKAISAWQKLQTIIGNNALYNCYNEHPYQYCLQFYLENARSNEPRFCSNPVIISTVQMLVNDEPGALDFLKIALKYKNEDLPVMITYPDFYELHNNPEFQRIAGEVGVNFPKK